MSDEVRSNGFENKRVKFDESNSSKTNFLDNFDSPMEYIVASSLSGSADANQHADWEQ